MSIRIVCSSCRKVYNLDETMQGKTVRCRECRSPIAVPSPARPGRRDDGGRPADARFTTSSRPAGAVERVSRDDDKPKRRPAERRAHRESKDSQGGSNLLLILLGVGAAVLVLGGLVIGGVLFILLGTHKSSGPVAAVSNEPLAGPLAHNDPPAGPVPGVGLEGDLAALKGTWQSGPVPADGGMATGTVKLSISPKPGSLGGRIQVEIATKAAGRTTSSQSSYTFQLHQEGGQRLLVTNVSRRGRGMTFVYRFDGAQLVLSGKLASVRIAYTLNNVALRRTSAEPQMAPAGNPANPVAPSLVAGGSGKGSPAALKFSGDVFSFVEEAVRAKRLADVDVRGFKLNEDTYRDVCEEGGVLIGFQVGLGKFINNDIVRSLRPIFLTKNGEKLGNWHGPVPAAPITLKAKPGYVVSALSVRTALAIDALTITFAKLGNNGLDLSDTYNSETAGGNGGRPSSIGGKGALFVGATGHLGHDGAPSSLGLVAVLPKN